MVPIHIERVPTNIYVLIYIETNTCAFRPAENRVFSSMLEYKCVRLLQSNPPNLSSSTSSSSSSLSSSSLSLLDIRLLTGRKHQIRAQLSHLGHPIVGDSVYGYVHHPSHPEAAARLVLSHYTFNYYCTTVLLIIVSIFNYLYVCVATAPQLLVLPLPM